MSALPQASTSSLPESDSDEWIITKTDKGVVKVATCRENETRIYDRTRDWVVNENKCAGVLEDNIFNDGNNIGNFLIRDLLTAELVGTHFICKNIKFNKVYLCGIVVNKYQKNDKYYVQVDDGTGNIRCIISCIDLNNLKKPFIDLNYEDSITNRDNECGFLQTIRLLKSSIEHMEKSIPSWDDIQLGDVLKIMGNISEYNTHRYVFITKIRKEPNESTAFNSYLENIVHLYTEVYDKKNM